MEGWVFSDGALHRSKDEIPRAWTRGNTPGFIDRRQEAAAREVAEFDLLMSRKVKQMPPSKLKNIDLVVGIPFYTEISNIVSVLVLPTFAFFHLHKEQALQRIVSPHSCGLLT